MSRVAMFRRSVKAAIDKSQAEVSAIVEALDETLEDLAVNTFGVPNPDVETMFSPPATPVRVKCLHCGQTYQSRALRLQYRPRMQEASIEVFDDDLMPLWWCPTPECDGAGFGHDIHPVKASRK